jgi:hypothetical protein
MDFMVTLAFAFNQWHIINYYLYEVIFWKWEINVIYCRAYVATI